MWLILSATIERITQRSSTCDARWGKSSLTSVPHSPCFANFHGDASRLPVFDSLELGFFERQRLAVHRGQFRLGIEQVDVRWSARHVEKNAALRRRAMVRGPDGVRVGGAVGRGHVGLRRLARQQVGERDQAKAVTGLRQKVAPGRFQMAPTWG